jgi:hypothetical protein
MTAFLLLLLLLAVPTLGYELFHPNGTRMRLMEDER